MSDEQPKTKHRNTVAILKRGYDIIRCVVVALLAVFLTAALFVAAPWKITLMIAIVLANLTVVPKPLRKYIDLGVSAVFIILLVWAFLPNSSSADWKAYTFDADLAEIEAARTIAAQDNAAQIYDALFADYDSDSFDMVFCKSDPESMTLNCLWSDKDFGEVAKWLDDNADVLDRLITAAGYKDCRFEIVADNITLDRHLLRLNLAKRWAEVLVRSINRDIGNSRIDLAADKICALRRMANHLGRQQTVFDYKAALHVELLAMKALGRLVVNCDATEQQLQRLETELEEISAEKFQGHWNAVFAWEKLFAKNVAGLFYEVNKNGRIRHSRQSIPAFDEQFDMGLYTIRRLRQTPRFTALLLCLTLPRSPERIAETIDTTFERRLKIIESDDAKEKEPPKFKLNHKGFIEFAAYYGVGFYYPLRATWLDRTAYRRESLILTALKRYKNKNGQWPQSLSQLQPDLSESTLIDPLNESSFVYQRQGEDFRLYSKGKNGVDDNGRHNSRLECDDRPIWPAGKHAPDSDKQNETSD